MSTKLGLHFVRYPVEPPTSTADISAMISGLGGTVGRYNTDWTRYQEAPSRDFTPEAAGFSSNAFDDYLVARGLGSKGNLPEPEGSYGPYNTAIAFQDMREAWKSGVSPIFNFNVIPDWARKTPDLPETNPKSFAMKDTSVAGQYLADFILYGARQDDGFQALSNMRAFQIFNEVNGDVHPYVPGYGYRSEGQLPYTEYFQILDHSIHFVGQALSAVKWTSQTGDAPPPLVMGPNLAGAYNPGFWNKLFDYRPLHTSTTNADGGLGLQAISLHPYGVIVQPWIDPLALDAYKPPAVESAWADVSDNLSYARMMLPTDDRIWWEQLVQRDGPNSMVWGLYTYASKGNTADEYFDRNAEVGIERTMALLTQNGYGAVPVTFTEFGASTYVGGQGQESLWDTTFADPYRYSYFGPGQTLPVSVAENLQAEAMGQTLGLIESWDFVHDATAYEFFDDANPKGKELQFGIAYNALSSAGMPQLKPAGEVLQAYMKGEALSLVSLSGGYGGVDIHVDGMGREGPFSPAARQAAAHELVLARDGDDAVDGGAGDDVIFAGPGDDKADGGTGYDKLYGGPGRDVLVGGPGADRLKGDSGDDMLAGGPGPDAFVFAAHGGGTSGFAGHDTITDFEPGVDKIVLIGGYTATDMLSGKAAPLLVEQQDTGLVLTYADNGATVTLQNISASQLSEAMIVVLTPDLTIAKVFDPG